MHQYPARSFLFIITVFFIAIAGLLLQACASKPPQDRFSESRGRNPEQMVFNMWDRNVDGIATCDEVRRYRNQVFDLLDADENRLLTKEELEAADVRNPFIRRATLDDFDPDHNGIVTGTEFSTSLPHFFKNNDANHDCLLTAAEAGVGLGRAAQERNPGEEGDRGGGRRRVASLPAPDIP